MSVKTPKVWAEISESVPHPLKNNRFPLGEFLRKTTYNPITTNF